MRRVYLLAAVLATGLVGCGADAPPPAQAGRPVKVAKLISMTPEPEFSVTGVAAPYREAGVSFEVSGRVLRILDVGRTVKVASRETADGTWIHDREIVATIDDTTYRQQRDAAALRLATARAGLKAQEIDLKEVAPAAIARAKAQRDAAQADISGASASIEGAQSTRDTAEADLKRNQRLFDERQISPSELDRYKNAFETAQANLAKTQASRLSAKEQVASLEAGVAEAEAAMRLKAGTLTRMRAEVAELQNAVEQAETNLERCVLRAPFAGRITSVSASPGDYMAAGKPVLTLTLIDPIKVSVTVSADRERQIKSGSHAFVTPTSPATSDLKQKGLFGTVFEKGAVADPATRTFQIDIMVRNARLSTHRAINKNVLRIGFREMLPAVERNIGEGGPLFVCKDCCVPEGEQTFVYRVRGAKFGVPRPDSMFDDALQLDKIPVRKRNASSDDFMQILNWSFRAVDPVEGEPALANGDLLINFENVDPERLGNGVVLERAEWAIRPGDLVPVRFSGEPAPEGMYVPDDAIRVLNDQHSVFVVEGTKVREVPVLIHESIGRLRRIVSAELEPGVTIVVKGVHYIADGATIIVSETLDLARAMRGAE